MVAESNPALRRGDSTSRRLRRGPRILLAGLAVAVLTGMVAAPLAAGGGADSTAGLQSVLALGGVDTTAGWSGGVANTSPVHAVADETTGLHVRVAPTISSTITLGAPVAVSVEIENATGEALAPGAVRLVRADDSIDDSAELEEWLSTRAEEGAGIGAAAVPMAESESRGLAAGGATVISFTVPGEAFAELADSAVIGLGAELVVGDTVVASGTDAYANADVPAAGHVAVALVAPLTAPVAGGAAGLIPADQLENWTGPTGLLTRHLDALAGRQVAIGLDPRILASIRVLGTSAPASATAWLQRLGNVSNEIFPLAYADADLAVQAQLGLPGLLAPTTFSDVLDPANFSAPAADDADGDAGDTSTGSTSTAEPTEPEPTPGAVPTTEEILEWPYTRSDIAWPADDTVAAGDLAFFDAAGLTTALLAPGNVEPADGVAEASATIDASTALVADAGLTAPLREASLASTDTEWRAASGLLLADLALDAGVARTTLLATFDRGAPPQAARVSALIDEIAGSAWSTLAGLSDAIGAPPEIRTLIDEPESEERRSAVGQMLTAEAEVTAFATVLTDDGLLTGPVRRELLSLLDVSWFDDGEAWVAAVDEWLAAQGQTLDAVSVVPSSTVNVLSRESPLPTTVQNLLPYPVTVVVNVAPSNGRLIVEDEVEVTVEPESRSTVNVPVAAGVGNGEVTLTVSLSSTTGVPVGRPVDIQANVQADWEGLGAAILATVAVLVFGIGIWRNIRRRRRQRAELAAAGSDEADAAAASGTAEAGAADSSEAPETAGRPREAAEPTDPRDG
jgi:hypothetical protein